MKQMKIYVLNLKKLKTQVPIKYLTLKLKINLKFYKDLKGIKVIFPILPSLQAKYPKFHADIS